VDANPALDSKIQVIYNPILKIAGATQVSAEASVASTSFTLGMVGRITESKGHMHLLGAVTKLRPEIKKQIRLVIVGAPSPGSVADLAYARRLKERASRLNLQDRILWAGYQTDPNPFYSSMDVLIQPSSNQAGEGMPLVILEAFRHGIPVIASRTGGIPEIINDGVNGLLFSPGDDNALAQALQQYLSDGWLRARLRTGSRATLTDQFSVENFQSKIRALVQEVSGPETPRQAQSSHGELAAWM
jgi:glycosyltransferase involved in cell wall biosynthesis